MPISLKRIPSSGALVLVGKCSAEGCLKDANFGIGMNLRIALNALEAGDKIKCKENLGTWFCREHRP